MEKSLFVLELGVQYHLLLGLGISDVLGYEVHVDEPQCTDLPSQ